MLHAKNRAPSAPEPVKLLDVQLSALIYLLARCVQRPCDGASAQLALDHLRMLSCNGEASALLRQTAGRLAQQWQRRGPAPAATADEGGPPAAPCRGDGPRLH